MKLYIPVIVIIIIVFLVGLALGVGFIGINQWNCRNACEDSSYDEECRNSLEPEMCQSLRKSQCRASCHFI